jgi:hypothetical protein
VGESEYGTVPVLVVTDVDAVDRDTDLDAMTIAACAAFLPASVDLFVSCHVSPPPLRSAVEYARHRSIRIRHEDVMLGNPTVTKA